MRLSSLALSAFALLLGGCPDPSPVLSLVGAFAEREPDGLIKVSGVVTNTGYDDYEEPFCLHARWWRGATIEYVKTERYREAEPVASGGEIIDEGEECVEIELKREREAFLAVHSAGPIEGDDVVIEVWARRRNGEDPYNNPTYTRFIGMPTAP